MPYGHRSALGGPPIGAALEFAAEPALDYPRASRAVGAVKCLQFPALRVDLNRPELILLGKDVELTHVLQNRFVLQDAFVLHRFDSCNYTVAAVEVGRARPFP